MGPLSFVMLIQVHHQYELTRNWSSHSISRISGVPMPSMPFYAPHAAADKVCCPYCNADRSVKNSLVPLSWRMVGTDGTVSWWHLFFFPDFFWGFCRFPSPFFTIQLTAIMIQLSRSVGIFWSKLLRVDYESLWIGCKGYPLVMSK